MPHERVNSETEPSSTLTTKLKYDFSRQHLQSADLFATEAASIERSTVALNEETRTKHRAYVTAAVLSAVSFLEAYINEFYHLAASGFRGMAAIQRAHIGVFVELWDNEQRFTPLLKYQLALAVTGRERFESGERPYQDVESLIKLRNCLVHYKPEWDVEPGQHEKLEKRLAGKFTLNPYGSESPLWMPHKCLGAGCADWSVVTARSFRDAFRNRMMGPAQTSGREP